MDNERIQRLHKFMKDFKMFLRNNYYDIENKDIQWYLRGLVQFSVNEFKERTMDYEKKYKESLDRAKNIYGASESKDILSTLTTIFPELRQNEDEKIKKDIIYFLSRNTFQFGEDIDKYKAWIAWLEKQGESKFKQHIQEGDKIVTNEDGTHFNVSQLERVAKKEPKFKVGDWVVNNNNGNLYEVIKIRDDEYCLCPLYAEIQGYLRIIDVDNDYHLWTIQDAKNGDVLQLGRVTSIFKDLLSDGSFSSYCSVYKGELKIQVRYGCYDATPATKEQRDLLFSKMKEAGYEWDDEKKEMKKINSYCQEHCKGYQETGKCFVDGECQAKREAEQNPVWSEDDEETLGWLCTFLKEYGHEFYEGNEDNVVDWLKSIKERMKGE